MSNQGGILPSDKASGMPAKVPDNLTLLEQRICQLEQCMNQATRVQVLKKPPQPGTKWNGAQLLTPQVTTQ